MIYILISFVTGIFLLFSIVTIYYRWADKNIYLIISIIAVLLANILFDNEYLNILSSIAFIGAAIGFSFKHNKSYQFFIIITSMSLALVFTANYLYLDKAKDVDIVSRSKDTFIKMIDESSEISEKEKKEFIEKLDESLDIIKDIIPFTYFLNSIILSLCCFSFMLLIFTRRFPEETIEIKGIEFFKIKDYYIFVLIAAWLTVLLVDSADYKSIYIISLNLGLILSVFYLIQSFGIIKHLLLKKGLPTFILPLSIFIIILIGIEYLLFVFIILSSLGALDFWADFRKLEAKKEHD